MTGDDLNETVLYWYNEGLKKITITSKFNADMGEGWIVITREEYDRRIKEAEEGGQVG